MFHVLDVLCSRYQELLLTMVKRSKDHDYPAVTCGGIYHKLADGRMILKCIVLKNVLAGTTALSDVLQSPHLEWSNAIHEIEAIKCVLQRFKSGDYLSSLMEEASEISEKCSIPLNITLPIYTTRRNNLDTPAEINEITFTKQFTAKVSDLLLQQIELRFPPESRTVFLAMDSLNPLSSKYLDEKLLIQHVDHYGPTSLGINKTLLLFEVRKFKVVCEDHQRQSETVINPDNHPNLTKLFHLKRSLPVSSAEAERSFSTMKRVKSLLRNRRTDDKLSELCLLSAERDLTKKLCIDSIIDVFNEKPRRIPLA